jgi:hypothetical protein
MNDLLGGSIAVVFPNITAQVVALHRSGKLRILGACLFSLGWAVMIA